MTAAYWLAFVYSVRRSEMEDLQVDIITAEEAAKITQDALVELEENRKQVLIIEIKRIESNIKCAAKKGKNQIELSMSDEAAAFFRSKGYTINLQQLNLQRVGFDMDRGMSTQCCYTITWGTHDDMDSGEEK